MSRQNLIIYLYVEAAFPGKVDEYFRNERGGRNKLVLFLSCGTQTQTPKQVHTHKLVTLSLSVQCLGSDFKGLIVLFLYYGDLMSICQIN